MKRLLGAALVVTLVAALDGCGAPVIRGEISLRDEQHHPMRLQGVSVALFREIDLKRHLANRALEAAKARELEERIRVLSDSVRFLRQQTDVPRKWRSQNEVPASYRESWRELLRIYPTLTEMEKRQLELGNPRHADFYLTGLPEPIASTETDAHGRFTLPTSGAGPFAIVARASRPIGDRSFQNYAWVVSAPSGRDLVLGDEMLTSAYSTLSLLHTERDIKIGL